MEGEGKGNGEGERGRGEIMDEGEERGRKDRRKRG